MVTAYVLIEMGAGHSMHLVATLKKCHVVKDLDRVTGPYDVIAVLEAPSLEEISHIATASKAGIQVRDPRDLEVQLSMLLSNPNLRASMGERGMGMVAENSGATERSLQILLPLIDHRIRY